LALSSAFTRARSSVVSPDRFPKSCSRRWTHFRSVSPEQPIFAANDRIAAPCHPWSSACSWTSRSARSRTSGENRVPSTMTPSSHEGEPCAFYHDSIFSRNGASGNPGVI
jgi:hypothetical protein